MHTTTSPAFHNFIFLAGKDFAIPENIEIILLGFLFSVVVSLFYYQKYRRPYYWWISMIAGMASAYIGRQMVLHFFGGDPAALGSVVAILLFPSVVVVAVNIYLASLKHKHRRRRRAIYGV